MTIGSEVWAVFPPVKDSRLVVVLDRVHLVSRDGVGACVLEQRGTKQMMHFVEARLVFPVADAAAALEAAKEEARRFGHLQLHDAVRLKTVFVGD